MRAWPACGVQTMNAALVREALSWCRDGRAGSDDPLTATDGGAGGAEGLAMSKVVLDVSMSLDGFTAGPNVRWAEPTGMAANACTHGWPGTPRW
jgi:hypothetical protein